MLEKWKKVHPVKRNKVYSVLTLFLLMFVVKLGQLDGLVALGVAVLFLIASNHFWRKSKKLVLKEVTKERKGRVNRLKNQEDDREHPENPLENDSSETSKRRTIKRLD